MALNASERGFIARECYMVIDWEMIKGWMTTGKGRLCIEQHYVKCAGVRF